MRYLFVLAVLLAQLVVSQRAPPVRVVPQQVLTLTGTLTMRPGGRLQFVTVKTAQAYVPVFAADGAEKAHEGKAVHEIALAGYHDYTLLYAHRGQSVTVTGALSTDDASPYYRDGMRLEAMHIQAANGAELIGKPAAPTRVAAETGVYRATAILPAELAAPWRYVVNRKAAMRGMLFCSSNGGGDVVNCFCADGFHPAAASSSLKGDAAKGDILDGGMAQFDVGDRARAVTLHVTCSR